MLNGILLARHGGAARLSYPVCGRRRSLLTLAIETSCDDTCVAILNRGRQNVGIPSPVSGYPLAQLLFNEKITVDSTAYNGIHPIEALDSHRANLAKLIKRSLPFLPAPETTGPLKPSQVIQIENGAIRLRPDCISVTRGPGMRSNLSCGLDTAKGLATAWGVPLVAVHHMQAHALTPRLAMAIQEPKDRHFDEVGNNSNKIQVQPRFPFLTLLVSGGHTLLVHSKGLTEHTVLASTADIAIGDALDKIGRLVLPPERLEAIQDTAFAKHLSEYAFTSATDFELYPVPATRGAEIQKPPNQYGWSIQAPYAETIEMTFSFSGIASRVESLYKKRSHASEGHVITEQERKELARAAVGIAFEHLASRTILALNALKRDDEEISTVVVSGGVAANNFLRCFLRQVLDKRGHDDIELVFPPTHLCTDNAAMIAWTGLEMLEAGFTSDMGCVPLSKWSMDFEADDGGIAGVDGWATRQDGTDTDQVPDQDTGSRVRMALSEPEVSGLVRHAVEARS